MHINPRLLRMIDGARNYAAAEKSDPFALDRAMTHIRTGIAGITPNGEDAFYKAEPHQEERLTPDGRPYMATVYRNIQRP